MSRCTTLTVQSVLTTMTMDIPMPTLMSIAMQRGIMFMPILTPMEITHTGMTGISMLMLPIPVTELQQRASLVISLSARSRAGK
jgi:hypothetical protein